MTHKPICKHNTVLNKYEIVAPLIIGMTGFPQTAWDVLNPQVLTESSFI